MEVEGLVTGLVAKELVVLEVVAVRPGRIHHSAALPLEVCLGIGSAHSSAAAREGFLEDLDVRCAGVGGSCLTDELQDLQRFRSPGSRSFANHWLEPDTLRSAHFFGPEVIALGLHVGFSSCQRAA